MRISLKSAATRYGGQSMALAAAISLAFAGTALARVHHKYAHPVHPNQYYGFYQGPMTGLPPAEVNGLNNFDQSGTIGRQGLGASPFYPEGPGNVSD